MERSSSARAYAAEALGTAILLATVVGSGIMADRLAGGNIAIALLGNTIPTGAILVVLITIFGPISGAHCNPAVSLVMAMRGQSGWSTLAPYTLSQLVGGVAGVWAAHLMFDLPVFQISTTMRWGIGQWIAEFVAAFGLILTIFGCLAHNRTAIPVAVGLYITAAYWFTASTSFANPVVTVARALSDTFAGIAPIGVVPFIAAQLAGAVTGAMLSRWLWQQDGAGSDERGSSK